MILLSNTSTGFLESSDDNLARVTIIVIQLIEFACKLPPIEKVMTGLFGFGWSIFPKVVFR